MHHRDQIITSFFSEGPFAVRVENSDNPGVTIGRVRRHSSDDEACISALLDYLSLRLYTVEYVALSDSDKSYRSSMDGFDACVKISCDIQCDYDTLLVFLSGYDVCGMTFA